MRRAEVLSALQIGQPLRCPCSEYPQVRPYLAQRSGQLPETAIPVLARYEQARLDQECQRGQGVLGRFFRTGTS